MQIARCTSCTAWFVSADVPVSASTAASALSPACSSSITASRAAVSVSVSVCMFDLSAFLSNSRTTATSTTDAPGSASAIRSAPAVLDLAPPGPVITSIMTCLLVEVRGHLPDCTTSSRPATSRSSRVA